LEYSLTVQVNKAELEAKAVADAAKKAAKEAAKAVKEMEV
jgi:hypothetical protein